MITSKLAHLTSNNYFKNPDVQHLTQARKYPMKNKTIDHTRFWLLLNVSIFLQEGKHTLPSNNLKETEKVNVEISRLLLWTWNDERFSSLRTSLGKKLILPTFQLDALVLLRVNEAKSRGTSIYSMSRLSRACYSYLPMLGMRIGCPIYDVVGRTWPTRAPPLQGEWHGGDQWTEDYDRKVMDLLVVTCCCSTNSNQLVWNLIN